MQGNAYAAQRADPRLACVRYGNVVGSRGSVVPVFQRAAEDDGVHHDHRRAHDALLDHARRRRVDLVLYALENMRGRRGLRAEDPVDARHRSRARRSRPDVPHELIGIRPGEKLHEMLITADDARTPSSSGIISSFSRTTSGGIARNTWKQAGANRCAKASSTAAIRIRCG